MKKIISIFLILCLFIIPLSACGKQNKARDKEVLGKEKPINDAREDSIENQNSEEHQNRKPDFGSLSDDIYSFQIEILSELYEFPMKFSDFISYGWTLEDGSSEKIDPDFCITKTFIKDGLKAIVDIINFEAYPCPIDACYIGGISLNSFLNRNAQDFFYRLPGGLEYKNTTLDEIKTAYGTPTDDISNELGSSLTYKKDESREIKIVFSQENDKIEELIMRNWTKPKNFARERVGVKPPQIVEQYTPPKKLGKGLDSFTIEYDGYLYKLPAPVRDFIANGWSIVEESTDMIVEAQGSGSVVLARDKKQLVTIANNYSNEVTSIDHCFIYSLKSGDGHNNNISIALPHNITIGMEEKSLEKALSKVYFNKDTSRPGYNYYRIISDKHHQKYEIYTDKEKVYKIILSNNPGYGDFLQELQ